MEVTPCGACGSTVSPELIISCCRCQTHHRHKLCIVFKEIHDTWTCDDCMGSDILRATNDAVAELQSQGTNRHASTSKATTGKLKVLSEEESLILAREQSRRSKSSGRKTPALNIGGVLRKGKKIVENILPKPKLIKTSTPALNIGGVSRKGKKIVEYILPKPKPKHLLHIDEVIWTGQFKIIDEDVQNYYKEFKACFSYGVQRKEYRFAKQMPFTAEMRMISESRLLEAGLNIMDITLYFYPVLTVPGSGEAYARLLENLQQRNLILMCRFGDVELHVFSSTSLNRVYRETIESCSDGRPLLCGTFRG